MGNIKRNKMSLLKSKLAMPKKHTSFRFIKRWLLRLILGRHAYECMCRTLSYDPRLINCHMVDIVVRKDGKEVRIGADWLKHLRIIVDADITKR